MSFLTELSTLLKRAGMTTVEDIFPYDSGADRINIQTKKISDYFDRFGLNIDLKSLKSDEDTIQIKAVPQTHGGIITTKMFEKIQEEFDEYQFIDFFDIDTDANTIEINFLKRIELY